MLDTNLNNKRAQHVNEKIGFRRAGIRYDSWKNQLGEPQSAVDYEMEKADFYRGQDATNHRFVDSRIYGMGGRKIKMHRSSYCGVNCEKCKVYIATMEDNDAVRTEIREAMPEHEIEDIIKNVLIGNAQSNALEFVAYLRASEMQFERLKGYWEDKYYWGIKYNNEFVCFVLVSSEDKTDHQSWTVWSDDSGADTFRDCRVDEQTKNILWANVNFCGNCGGCSFGKGKSKTIFGKKFDNVCLTFLKFITPETETVEYMKKMAEIRKNGIIKDSY